MSNKQQRRIYVKKTLVLIGIVSTILLVACSGGEDKPKEVAPDIEKTNAATEDTKKEDDIIAAEVSIDTNIDEDGKITIKGETNIPDGGELQIEIHYIDGEYSGIIKSIIKNGEFEGGPFSDQGDELPEGYYQVSIGLLLPSGQSDDFLEKTGKEYENLSPGYSMDDAEAGRSMRHEEIIEISEEAIK